jgi:hypothetical protein
MTEVEQIYGLRFPNVLGSYQKNRMGYILGDYFHKLIWSHYS